ncbi:marvel domain-containing protein [Lophiotrema nucula]|uniref:Marvel domain-containing protein n=1 Tax=Lophiotrema nucula TaxID=690887 RepID=A0A6A5YTG7_9PLEO|nr:marvel domain-containing protein [Lophiotrema nucula]
MALGIVNLALRGFQVIFAVIVLALSVDLIKKNPENKVPAIHGYAAFVGAVSLVAAFIGIAAHFISFLEGIISSLVDGFIILVNIAGGIVVAYTIRGIKCSTASSTREEFENARKLAFNSLIGCKHPQDVKKCPGAYSGSRVDVIGRCKENQADTAFLFLTAITCIGAVVITWLHVRNK